MYTYFLAALLLLSNVTYAKDACDIKNIKDFYRRVRSSGPIVREAVKRKEMVSSAIDIAKQRPNPELDLEYLKGDQFGLEVNTYALAAKHTVEFGSKRDKRVAKANSLSRLKNSEIDLSLFNSNLNASKNYQRIGQLNITIGAVKEAIHTFYQIIQKLSSRKRLNPEETVSLSTLRLAANGYKAELNDMENEKTLLVGKVSFLANCKKVKPVYRDLKYHKAMFSEQNSEKIGLLKLEDFKVDLAINELEVQKSLGYSNISIGPKVEYQGQGSDEFVSAGVSLSFALPLFQTNNGGKLSAFKGVLAQKVQSDNRKKMLKIKRAGLLVKFKRSFSTLSGMPSLKALELKHQNVDRLFSRGVVSISMTIESHRQQIEFLKSRFETENDVLDTYGKLIIIDGNTAALEELF